jgi:hypothetical protein
MKNKIKTNNTSFQSYLTRVTNENFEKMKKDRYVYDEGEILNKVKKFFFGKDKKDDDGDFSDDIKTRKTKAVKTAKEIRPIYEVVKQKFLTMYNPIKNDFNEFFDKDKKNYVTATRKLIGKYLKKMLDGFGNFFVKMFKKITFQESKKNKHKKDINIFTEAAKTTKYVKIGGKYVSGIFTYNFNGTDYVVNTLSSPMTFTVRKFMATPNFPTIDDAWKSILGKDYNTLQAKIKTVTPDEQQIEFNQPLFNTKIRPFLIGEGDVVSTKAEQKDQEREDKLKLNVAETKRDVKKIDRRTERMETSIQNIDQRTMQTFISQNRILVGIIIIIVLLAAIIGFIIYSYLDTKEMLTAIQDQNIVADKVNALRFEQIQNDIAQVQTGVENIQLQNMVKDSADAARYSNVLTTITQSTDDAANKVISNVNNEIQNAKKDIINKIGKSSSKLQNLITKNNLNINQAKTLIQNLDGDLKKMGQDLKEQGFENTKTIITAVSDTREDILKEMQENDETSKGLLNTINSRTTEIGNGLFANEQVQLIGIADKIFTDAEERLRKEALESFWKAKSPGAADLGFSMNPDGVDGAPKQ